MPQSFHAQVIASTRLDFQGEKLTKSLLQKMVDGLPSRYPLSQRHDMSMETLGYIENVRLVQDPDDPEEYQVIADVHVTKGTLDNALRGFSISTIETIDGRIDSPSLRIYLPFPQYNDADLVKSLLASDQDLLVGKWIKKGADPNVVTLVVTGIALLLSPEWTIQYQRRVRPAMERALAHIKKLRSEGLKPELVQHIIGRKNETVKLYFVPDNKDVIGSYEESKLVEAIRKVSFWLESDEKANKTGVEMVRLYFDIDAQEYKIFHVQYSDGSDVNIA